MPKFNPTSGTRLDSKWLPGVAHDPSMLPTINDPNDGHFLEWKWDLIVKEYDPETDDFTYSRITDCHARTRFVEEKSTRYIPENERVIAFTFHDQNGSIAIKKGQRIVAIIPHPNWKKVYDSRLLPDTFVEAKSDA